MPPARFNGLESSIEFVFVLQLLLLGLADGSSHI